MIIFIKQIKNKNQYYLIENILRDDSVYENDWNN